MTKKVRAPSKIVWRLRYKGCPHGKLKKPKGQRKCKRKAGRKKRN